MGQFALTFVSRYRDQRCSPDGTTTIHTRSYPPTSHVDSDKHKQETVPKLQTAHKYNDIKLNRKLTRNKHNAIYTCTYVYIMYLIKFKVLLNFSCKLNALFLEKSLQCQLRDINAHHSVTLVRQPADINSIDLHAPMLPSPNVTLTQNSMQ